MLFIYLFIYLFDQSLNYSLFVYLLPYVLDVVQMICYIILMYHNNVHTHVGDYQLFQMRAYVILFYTVRLKIKFSHSYSYYPDITHPDNPHPDNTHRYPPV